MEDLKKIVNQEKREELYKELKVLERKKLKIALKQLKILLCGQKGNSFIKYISYSWLQNKRYFLIVGFSIVISGFLRFYGEGVVQTLGIFLSFFSFVPVLTWIFLYVCEAFLGAKSMVAWNELMRRISELDVELIHINSEILEIERQIQLCEKE
ncbi:hypothetical protein [Enterococcus faecalis]|jgi:hypothetical protein|uniref:hypothetical protein n=1 Tax=Enterococcus faecalis TaxID=1351 RepID=UPI0021C57892|nr:hypothetical protein [Enterococcus faecalis]